jgi:hypothetical protein
LTPSPRRGTIGWMRNAPMLHGELAKHLESWLRKHGHKLDDAPLAPEAITSPVDCLTIDDQARA